MDKRKLYHRLKMLRKLYYVLLLALALGAGLTAIFALRANNQQMIVLRAAVFEADEKDGDIEGALRALREYVYSHMNTDLSAGPNAVKPPIQLKYEYERLVIAEKARFDAETAQIGAAAQAACPGGSQAVRFPCVQNYVNAHSTVVRDVPEDKYKFDFVSPKWSPDLAGWSIVFAVASMLLFVLFMGGELLIRRELKHNN